MISHLVDSDRTIDYLNERPDAIEALDGLIRARQLGTPVIVVGEVREGFVGHDEEMARNEDFLASIEIVEIDREVASIYAELRSSLRGSGQLMSDNDLWIAATALRHGLTLISRDRAFDRIPGLKLLRWIRRFRLSFSRRPTWTRRPMAGNHGSYQVPGTLLNCVKCSRVARGW